MAGDAAGARGAHAHARPAGAGGSRPNVLVIMTDDQRWDTLDVMPTVRRELVDRGTSFTNAFVPNALCCPSRASTLTGLHSHTTGVLSNGRDHGGFDAFVDGTSIATVLDAAGYRTALIGKYLNGYIGRRFDNYEYVPPGWDSWFAVPTGAYYNYTASADGVQTSPFGEAPSDYAARVMTQRARDVLEQTPRIRPFFMLFSATAPHVSPVPIDGVQLPIPGPNDVDRFRDIDPWRPPTHGSVDDVSDMPSYVQNRSWLPAVQRRIDLLRQRQLESLFTLDKQIGRLLDSVPRNTLVIFLSDNGVLWGEHRWKSKKVPTRRASASR